MRKLFFGAMALATALTVAFTVPGTASAEEAAKNSTLSVGFTGDSSVLCIDSGATMISVGETAVKKTKEGYEWKTVTNYDVYQVEDDQVLVDISKYNAKKDVYLSIREDNLEPVVYKLGAPVETKLKAKYDDAKGVVAFTVDGKATDIGKLNYRVSNSDAAEVTLQKGNYTVPEMYRMTGASLYFSTPLKDVLPNTPAEVNFVSGKTTTKVDSLKAFDLGNRAGADIKVTVKKRANAPKVSANYVKGTVTIPKGVVYEVYSYETTYSAAKVVSQTTVDAATTFGIGGTVKVGSKEFKALGGDDLNVSSDFGITVFKKGTDKKSDSKLGLFVFPAVNALKAKVEDEKTAIGEDAEKGVEVIDGVTFTVTKDTKGNRTLTVTNTNESAYSFTIGEKTYTIGKAKGTAAATKKIAKIPVYQVVTISKTGDAKSMTWTTPFIKVGITASGSATAEAK